MIRVFAISLLIPGAILAQWSYCSGTSGPVCVSSNVGIGNTSPGQALTVGSSAQFTVSSAGAVVTSGGISSPTGGQSEAFGSGAIASSGASVAVGFEAVAGSSYSTALGHSTNAGGEYGTAVGSGSSASGSASVAIGYLSSASGDYSFAAGGAATGGESVALGYGALAAGQYSFAANFGSDVLADGGIGIGGSVSIGSGHTGSMAFGYQATTTAANQFVVGGPLWYITDLYLGKGVSAASPTALTIHSTGASGTNVSGANISLAAGMATGSATGGDVVLQTSDATASGTTLQSLSTKLIVKDNGSVGIGTTVPCSSGTLPTNCLLSVNGGIRASEVVVTTTGADYVFDDSYKLQPLSDVAAYIAANHHLPDMPSAEEMKEKGASVSEMQSKLLAKVEELTLHMIEAEERSKRLERDNEDLRKETRELRQRLDHMELDAMGRER